MGKSIELTPGLTEKEDQAFQDAASLLQQTMGEQTPEQGMTMGGLA